MLPIVSKEGKTYFFDQRLCELRNTENPHERITLDKDECDYITYSKEPLEKALNKVMKWRLEEMT